MPKLPTAPPVERTEARSIYPALDSLVTPSQQDRGFSFRLTEIRNLECRLEQERDHRANMYKKCRRAINVIDGIDTVLVTSSFGMGAAGVGLLSTIIAAPVVVALEAAALACGLAGIAGKYISRRLLVKAKKHDEIRVLALSKLSSITDVISNALRDGHISPEEFKLVLDEVEKYGKMKADIRKKTRKAHAAQSDEAAKNELMAEARASIMKELAAVRPTLK